jgi:hypothetical protein
VFDGYCIIERFMKMINQVKRKRSSKRVEENFGMEELEWKSFDKDSSWKVKGHTLL